MISEQNSYNKVNKFEYKIPENRYGWFDQHNKYLRLFRLAPKAYKMINGQRLAKRNQVFWKTRGLLVSWLTESTIGDNVNQVTLGSF